MTGTINNIGVNVAGLIIESAYVVLGAELFIDKNVNIKNFSVAFSPGFVIPDFPADQINDPLGIGGINGFPEDGLAQEIADFLNREKYFL